jgi:hypothetical protein
VQVPQIAVVTAQSARLSLQTGVTTMATMTMMMTRIGKNHYRQTDFALHLANKS